MADPRDKSERGTGPRDQFSISMLHDLHLKLDKLAGMRQMTTSQLIEKICLKEVAIIDDATWDMIDKVREHLDESAPLEPKAAKSKRAK